MKILLTNDDSAYAQGIHTLASVLSQNGNDVTIVAPDGERSGCGHGMTMTRPVRISKLEDQYILGEYRAYKCDALPTDCVILACDVLKLEPDLLISGINNGPNVADDMTYSGTVCAAMEGLVVNIPSIAVSLATSSKDLSTHYETAANVTLKFIEWLFKHEVSPDVLFNINVPNIQETELKGILFTKKGIRKYIDRVKPVEDNSGTVSYLIGGKIEDSFEEGSDVTAIRDKFVSVTPICMEMTDFAALEKCRQTANDLKL